MEFKTAYGKKTKILKMFDKQGRTKQSHKNECDINQIMAKFQKTGVLTHAKSQEAEYGDIPSVDFQEAMNIVIQSREMFAELPSSVRKRFNNSAQNYLEFLENPDNKEEMRKMGLLKPELNVKSTLTEEEFDEVIEEVKKA